MHCISTKNYAVLQPANTIPHQNYAVFRRTKKVSILFQKPETSEQGHELRSLIGSIRQKVNAVNAALDVRQHAADNVRRCQVEVELAKNEIRAQYETNYPDARKLSGKQVAESLFPKVVNRKTEEKKMI
jgi:hypothetical protein